MKKKSSTFLYPYLSASVMGSFVWEGFIFFPPALELPADEALNVSQFIKSAWAKILLMATQTANLNALSLDYKRPLLYRILETTWHEQGIVYGDDYQKRKEHAYVLLSWQSKIKMKTPGGQNVMFVGLRGHSNWTVVSSTCRFC